MNVLVLSQVAPQSSLLPLSTMSFPNQNHQKLLLRPRSLSAPHKKRPLESQLQSIPVRVPLLLQYLKTQVKTAWCDKNEFYCLNEEKQLFLFSPAQKKKRRRNRWSSGFLAKKKSTSSPHTSRDDSHLGSDDEDDGDDGEDVERGGGTSFNKGAGDKKEQNVADREGPPQGEQQEESEENKVSTKTGNENSDSIPLNTSHESHQGIESDTQASPSTGKSGKTNSQKQTETDSNEAIMEEAQQSSYAEPMEGEAAEMTTPGTSKVVKGDDTGKGWMFTSSYAYSLIFNLHCKGKHYIYSRYSSRK